MHSVQDAATSASSRSALRSARDKDLAAGALATVIGLVALVLGVRYGIGSLAHMGPGFYPSAVGALLAVVGVVLVCAAWTQPRAETAPGARGVNWRALSYIGAGLVGFIVAGAYAGLVPASFVIAFATSLSDRSVTWRNATLLAVAVSVVAAVLFGWLLQLQMPLLRWGS